MSSLKDEWKNRYSQGIACEILVLDATTSCVGHYLGLSVRQECALTSLSP